METPISSKENAYVDVNKAFWNKRAEVHIDSEFYDVKAFKAGKSSLNQIELDLIGDVRGKKLLHLQCHFGQDTLSWARLGAEVTGVDLSDTGISQAKQLAKELDIKATFICCNVLDLDKVPEMETYDIIFTSYGTIGWLPELDTWGRLIKQHLKPGGRFYLIEFHPAVWMFDDDFEKIAYSYFNKQAYIEESEGSYADKENKSNIKGKSYCWNHSFGEVFDALLKNGLSIETFKEYDYSPYNCFNKTVKTEKGYQIKGFEGNLPMVYALTATAE